MIINKWTYGRPHEYEDFIATTFKTEYFPCYVRDLNNQIIEDVYSYRKPETDSVYCSSYKQYGHLFRELKTSGSLCIFDFKFKGEEFSFYFFKGMILDLRGNILLCLSTNTIFYYDENDNILTEHLKLFISVDFIQTEHYKNVFKKVQSEYIDWCYDNGIPVEITTSKKIEDQMFNNEIEFSFENLEELQEHLESGVGDNLFFEVPVEEGTPVEEYEPPF